MYNHHPMHLTPTFSVITVCRNAADTIEDTLQSVITQTYHHIEYIIIDGASTDRTLDIIGRYREHITTLISEPDKGLYDAMNKGIEQATGEYLCFLNAGDSFHEDDTLQSVVHQLNADAHCLPDIIYGETALVDAERHFLRMRRLSTPSVLNYKSFRSGMVVCHQAFWVRRTFMDHACYDLHYRYSADYEWCLRLLLKCHNQGGTIMNTHLTLIDYLNEGMTTRNHRASLKERFRIMSRYYGLPTTLALHLWFVIRLLVKR